MRFRPLLLVALVGLLGASLAMAFQRELLELIRIPYNYALWFGRAALSGAPQTVLWGLLGSVGAIILLRSATTGRETRQARKQVQRPPTGTVEGWLNVVSELDRGGYFRWRLTNRLSHLVLEQLAYKLRSTPAEVRSWLGSGQIDLPDEVRQAIEVGLAARATEYLSGASEAAPMAMWDPEVILTFLEGEL